MNQATGKSENEDAVQSVLTYNVSEAIGKDYVDVFYDVSRMLVIQTVIQLLMSLTSPEAYPFFSTEFILMCLYIVLGVLVYWLIFKKLVHFK